MNLGCQDWCPSRHSRAIQIGWYQSHSPPTAVTLPPAPSRAIQTASFQLHCFWFKQWNCKNLGCQDWHQSCHPQGPCTSRDISHIASHVRDKTVRIWDARIGMYLSTVKDHTICELSDICSASSTGVHGPRVGVAIVHMSHSSHRLAGLWYLGTSAPDSGYHLGHIQTVIVIHHTKTR